MGTIERSEALLVECDPGCTLGGSCQRDAINMTEELVRIGIPRDHIRTLITHGGVNSSSRIFEVARDIILRRPSLFIMLITGHGFSVPDKNGDEIDGADEAINIGRVITDDQIYDHIVMQLQCPAILFADTCHSGTMFDLPFTFNGYDWSRATRRMVSQDPAAPIISLSACTDSQLSMCDVGVRTGFGGSLTTALLNISNALESLVRHHDIIGTYRKIQAYLAQLRQTCVLSATTSFISTKSAY